MLHTVAALTVEAPRRLALPPARRLRKGLTMDWSDSEDQRRFREEVRAFIADRLPQRYRRHDINEESVPWFRHRRSDDPELRNASQEWAAALAERHWVAPAWPVEFGGGGLSVMEQYVMSEEMARAGAPSVGGNGVAMLGPTLIMHGTKEQQERILPPVLTGEVAWAQGYSEPGAGSDLAAVSTRAVRDGDEYVINGQKIWTTNADVADAVFLLVRTDPAAPKHKGISFLLVEDIHAPGINVRPLPDAAFGQELTETFYDDVRVPASNLVGRENEGWRVAMTLLDFERSGVGNAARYRQTLTEVVDYLKSDEGSKRAADNSSARAAIADRWIEAGVLYNFSLRIATLQSQGVGFSYEASMSKLFGADLAQAIPRTVMRTFGLYSTLWQDAERAPFEGLFTRQYVRTIPLTIGGGSNEIQRGLIATRGLGLPRG